VGIAVQERRRFARLLPAHPSLFVKSKKMDCRVKPGNDEEGDTMLCEFRYRRPCEQRHPQTMHCIAKGFAIGSDSRTSGPQMLE
jgi:hypothetical protein